MNYKIRRGVLKRYKDEKNVTEIFIPDSVDIIGEGAFNGCTNLVRILIPDSVKVISDTAFNDCENLKCISLPESFIWILRHFACPMVKKSAWKLITYHQLSSNDQ